ncbi:MAG: hypothetical protein QM763_00690 [Agriterribacter sp.]
MSIWFLVLLGLANSMVWAGIWPLALDGLGKFTKLGASIMIMGLCGNALLPLVYGHFADRNIKFYSPEFLPFLIERYVIRKIFLKR